MATATDKKKWDKLHDDLAKADAAESELESALAVKYGREVLQPSNHHWMSRAERTKLEKAEARVEKIHGQIYELVTRISPRDWGHGVPGHWVTRKLTWEDAIRPKNEPLSVVVPGSYGYPDGYVKENEMARTAEKSKIMASREARKRKSHVASFDNEEEVLADVAKALDVSPEDLSIEEDGNLSGFGATTTIYHVELGSQEYTVVKDEDEMRALALAIVKQDLEEDPTMFNRSFIEQHIDIDQLRKDLESDVLNSRIDDLTYEAERNPDDFWREYEREGFDAPEEDEDGERPEPEGTQIEELAEKQVAEQLRDPMQYLEDIYGAEDAAKQAIDIAGIDVDAAAEDAVDTDGPAHFVARYDSEYHTTPSGFVYWRDN